MILVGVLLKTGPTCNHVQVPSHRINDGKALWERAAVLLTFLGEYIVARALRSRTLFQRDEALLFAMPTAVLSSQGLERAASISDKDFAFIGKRCTIQGTKCQAAFISPRAYSLLLQDRTMESLFLDCDAKVLDEKRLFAVLEQLVNGCSVDLGHGEVDGFLEAAAFLGNAELVNEFINEDESIDRTTICSRLRKKFVAGR